HTTLSKTSSRRIPPQSWASWKPSTNAWLWPLDYTDGCPVQPSFLSKDSVALWVNTLREPGSPRHVRCRASSRGLGTSDLRWIARARKFSDDRPRWRRHEPPVPPPPGGATPPEAP